MRFNKTFSSQQCSLGQAVKTSQHLSLRKLRLCGCGTSWRCRPGAHSCFNHLRCKGTAPRGKGEKYRNHKNMFKVSLPVVNELRSSIDVGRQMTVSSFFL